LAAQKVDAARFARTFFRMAKPAAVRTRFTASQTKIRDAFHVFPAKTQKPSALLDTRVVYAATI